MGQQTGPNQWSFTLPDGSSTTGRGATEQEARQDVKARFNGMATQSVATGQKEPDIVGRIKQALISPPEQTGQALAGNDVSTPGGLGVAVKGAAQAVGQAVLPNDIPEAAIMAALPFAGKLGTAVTSAVRGMTSLPGAAGAAGLATRVGVPAAVGAASSAAMAPEGERGAAAQQGAILGTTAAGVAEAFRGVGSLVEAAGRAWGQLDTTAFKTRVRNILGPEMAKRVEADIPSLNGKIKNVSDLIGLTDEATGRKILASMFDKQEDQIIKAIGKAPVAVPTDAVDLARGIRGPAATQAVPSVTSAVASSTGGLLPLTPMTADQAIKLNKVLRAKGLSTKDPDAHLYRQAADQVLDTVKAAAPPTQATEYEALRQDYRKFMNLRDFLSQNTDKLFPGLTSKGGGTVDLVLFGDRLIKNIADVSPQDFPALHDMFSGGGGVGTRPVGGALPLGKARMSVPVPGAEKFHMYEGGRFPTVKLPEPLRQQVQSALPGKIAGAGRAAATAGTPALGEMERQ